MGTLIDTIQDNRAGRDVNKSKRYTTCTCKSYKIKITIHTKLESEIKSDNVSLELNYGLLKMGFVIELTKNWA